MPVMEEQSSPRREYPETFEENRQRNSKEDNEETHTILRRRMTAGSPSRVRASFFNLIAAIATGSEAGSPNYGKQRRGSQESRLLLLERILCPGRGERWARFRHRRGAAKRPRIPCSHPQRGDGIEWECLRAGMAELADAADSKSADPCGHGGSTPPPGTISKHI